MNGTRPDNSTFTRGATRGKKKILSEWQRKPWFHRAAIRVGVTYPILMLLALWVYVGRAALLGVAFYMSALTYLSIPRIQRMFFDPFTTSDVDTGLKSQHWALKPRWRRLFRRQEHLGVVTRRNELDDLDDVQKKFLLETLNREQEGQTPITRVGMPPISRYRRRALRNDR